MSKRTAAIVLAAGQGKRMGSTLPKQYLLLQGKPIIAYALEVFSNSFIEEIVLVVKKGDVEYCKKEIIEKYNINKVVSIVEGGEERYHSVYEGLKVLKDIEWVYIHDGARPFVTNQMIQDAYEKVQIYQACVIGMPVKDTIKIVDKENIVKETPKREQVWLTQSPQVFSYQLIRNAYEKLFQTSIDSITDDAQVVETMLNYPVVLMKGSYENIKITTPEDLEIAETLLTRFSKKSLASKAVDELP